MNAMLYELEWKQERYEMETNRERALRTRIGNDWMEKSELRDHILRRVRIRLALKLWRKAMARDGLTGREVAG